MNKPILFGPVSAVARLRLGMSKDLSVAVPRDIRT
jgi:hypothetical protein